MKIKATLENWKSLNAVISSLTEKDVERLLEYEYNNKNRKTFMHRLGQRLNAIQSTALKKELRRSYNDAN